MSRSVYGPAPTMADEEPTKEPTKEPILYGSAGMAASGMMPGLRRKKKPNEEDEVDSEAEESTAQDENEAGENTLPRESEASEASDASPESKPEPEPEPEPVEPAYQGLKAVVMGHTGAGDFGSHLDLVFQRLDGVRLFAISDGDTGAVDEALIKAGAPNGYSDFWEMLETEKPDLVSVAPRWTDQHAEMTRAALEAGAHVLCEKPFTRTLKEADELISLAEEKNLRIAIANPMRCDPHVLKFHEEYRELIGEILEMHLFGKMDQEAGGEDLLIQGSQLFDLARLFAGDPSYCSATVTREGIPAIAEDAHESEKSQLGPLLGDTIRAQFVMESGVHLTFVSDPKLRGVSGPWGIEFVGEKGRMRLFANQPPIFSRLASSSPRSHTRSDIWQLWPQVKGPYHSPVEKLTQLDAANRLLVNDWLDAIRNDRAPQSSGDDGRKALEMVHGVWQAAVTMKRAYFPLVNRLHPLSEDAS